MIREIINFVKHLEDDYPEAFELNKKPSPGLHLWVELDEDGKWKNNEPQEGVDYVVYDGKQELKGLLFDAIKYEELGKRVGTRMDKVLDTAKIEGSKKFQIFSCSPFIVSFKKQSWDLIPSRIHKYFENSFVLCLSKDDETTRQNVLAFKNELPLILAKVDNLKIEIQSEEDSKEIPLLSTFKDDFYINIYLKNVDLDAYKEAHERYLKAKLFNTDTYNSTKEITDSTYGLSNFINGANSKKPFLEHKSASMHKGISGRITAKDAVALNLFEILTNNKVLPNPLPIFVDKSEFKDNSEIIRIFNEEGERNISYPQILKSLFEKNDQRILANYYLLNISRGVVNDFDFVSCFQYKLEKCSIDNLFQLTQKKELLPRQDIHTIFGFENIIVSKIFNNALVRKNKNGLSYNYFNDIDPNYVSGGDVIADLILRFRKAFYDYIYKSRKQSITPIMFDEIMLKSIISDIRHDEFKDNYHSNEKTIKEKLNIWFSLYNYFNNQSSQKRINMANRFKELLNKMEGVANDDNLHFSDDVAEFLFGAGQVIYYLLSRSKASNPSHALLEPFLQKTNASQLQNAIANAVNVYKHDISFGKGRFERLCAQVLSFETDSNLKNYQRYLLAGYFAPAVIYTKKEKDLEPEISNN